MKHTWDTFCLRSSFDTHYSSNHAGTHTHAHMRTHSYVAFMTGFLCVWFLCSLCCTRQLNPVSFLLFYTKDPPWISALTPDERPFISELLTKFYRVCFLFEEKIKKKILSNTFFIVYSTTGSDTVSDLSSLAEFEVFCVCLSCIVDRRAKGPWKGLKKVQGVLCIMIYDIWPTPRFILTYLIPFKGYA